MEVSDPTRPDTTSRLVPGRECGSCIACCVSLTIDEPALRKPQGYRCRNVKLGGGCSIYADRPETCRTFYCGWRLLKWVKEPLRPDLSGVLITLRGNVSAAGLKEMGIAIMLLERRAFKAEGLAETVAAAVNADLPTYLTVPGRPGFTSGTARIDDALRPAVMTRDKAAVLEILRSAQAQGSKGARERIVLEPETRDVPGPRGGD